MFEAPDCGYCLKWDAEVGVVYARTAEARIAPLRRLQLAAGTPAGLMLREEVRYTPTFVLVRDGRELDRITGYLGEEQFWGLLGVMLARHASQTDPHIPP